MTISQLLDFMKSAKDPYDPVVERKFKNTKPEQDEDPEIALRYWELHFDLYGTPSSHMAVRAMYANYKRMVEGMDYEMRRQTEIIVNLRQELKEAKARNTMYLSKIQEFEAREQ
jgi:hypothetical protein